MVALVKLICEIGPDIAEISRRLGQHKETVRYRYNQKVIDNGFTVQGIPNYGALGLRRQVMRVRVAQDYSELAEKLFSAMSDLCYVVAYAGTMPDGAYLLHAAVPAEFEIGFRSMMAKLKEMGIFDSIDFFNCEKFMVAPMRAESFDFDHSAWDFDWGKPLRLDGDAVKATLSEKQEFDKVDLLLVKEISKEGRQSLSEIRESIKRINGVDINYKTLVWHYSHHVVQRNLVKGYSIGWHGVRYNFESEKKKLRPHGYLVVALIVTDVSEQERFTLMGTLNRLPFLLSEAVGKDYYAQLAFPVENSNDALEYLGRLIKPFGSRAEFHALNQKEMLSFTIGHNLWDASNGRWSFEPSQVLGRFEALLGKLREIGAARG